MHDFKGTVLVEPVQQVHFANTPQFRCWPTTQQAGTILTIGATALFPY